MLPSSAPLAAVHAALTGMAGMSMGHARVDLHNLLLDWLWQPFPIAVDVVLLAAAGWYLRAVDRLDRRGRQWHAWRTVAFLAGLFSVWLALCSSIATFTGQSFVFHIFQHLLLMVLAPPLGALGAPMTLLLQTSDRRLKTQVLKALHSPVFAVIRHPIPVFFLYYLSMYAFFLTGAVGWAMDHMWAMDLINLGFLFGATLFWWPMLGVDPIPGGRMNPGLKIINLLIGVPVESFLGIALMEMTVAAGPMYTVASTHAGGAVLWAASEAVTLLATIPVFVEWVRSDARAARRIDARLDAGQPLPAPPAAGAGMGATLRSLRRG